MKNALFTRLIKNRAKLLTAALVVTAFLLFLGIGYSSGYGRVVNDEVVFIRKPLLFHMGQDYRRDGGEWSFGYFVPLAVAALFWFRRKELLSTPVQTAAFTGLGVVVLGLLFYFAGYRGEQKYFGYAAIQIMALGTVFWFLGWAWFRKIFWLWLLLGMMWPWRFLIEHISSPLQLIMVKLTSAYMRLVGIDSLAHGSELRTGTLDPKTGSPISLDVDVECSGMRSLFALVMLGMVFSFLRVKDEWKRWVVMAFVPVVAVLGNFVRMLMLYYGSAGIGTRFAIGESHDNPSTFHIGAGLMVFVVALFVLSGLVAVLEKGSGVLRGKRAVSRVVGEPAKEGQ